MYVIGPGTNFKSSDLMETSKSRGRVRKGGGGGMDSNTLTKIVDFALSSM